MLDILYTVRQFMRGALTRREALERFIRLGLSWDEARAIIAP